ncbi:MAG TPA: ABC transporter substrate-binding protein [Methylomirabilota bacterium]|nr:ABC transporter substrate-binding protein [Methylomirabilota bacterium]
MRSRSVSPARLALLVLGVLAVLAWAPAAGGSGPGPTEQLKGAIDRVLVVLEDPALKAPPQAAERRREIRRIADEIFDFEEIARRAMGQHWRTLAPGQQREFVTLFSDLLEQAYMSKIETYGGERIQYVGERVEGDYATVSTRITTDKGTEVPIDYRALRRAERWRVYDVTIEGVSLVANYRTQFNSLMRTSSPEQLLAKLRSRVREIRR